MPVTLGQFQAKAELGNAARIELDQAGSGLHRKGLSAGGKAVEWLRSGLGLRDDSNQRTLQAFVTALKSEYGATIGGIAEAALLQDLGGGTKPLSSRHVRHMLGEVEQLRANAADTDKMRAVSYSQGGDGTKVTGFTSAALAAQQATGVAPEVMGSLFNPNDPAVAQLQTTIHDRIIAAGQDARGGMTAADAQGIAEAQIKPFLVKRADNMAIDHLVAGNGPGLDVQELASHTAQRLNLPGLADALADPGSEASGRFRKLLDTFVAGRREKPLSQPDLEQAVTKLMPRFMQDEVVAGGHVADLRRMPDEPGLANDFAERLMRVAKPGMTDTPAIHQFLASEMMRLGAGSDAEKVVASDLHARLHRDYTTIDDQQVKLDFLRFGRDAAIKEAEARGPDAHKHWLSAAGYQNDIVALNLRDLNQPLTSQSRAALDAAAAGSRDLSAAMADLDALQREYVISAGGNPASANLDWSSGREQLANVRGDARALTGQAEGNELQALIAAKMRGLTADLLAKAASVLGPAPAPYAVVSLGSASRGEASPYSDVEFAILLDKPATPATQDYMLRLSRMVQFQVMNLGENAGLEAPAGFHWDLGGNSPSDAPDTFIGTADQLVRKNLRESPDGGPAELFGLTMFAGPELLHSNIGTDGNEGFALVKDFQGKVDAHFKQPSTNAAGQTIGQTLGRFAAREGVNLANLHQAAVADRVDVKAISRMPMLLAQGLALEHGVMADAGGHATNSTLMRISALADRGVLSRADADVLSNATVALGKARIEAHLHSGEADDTVWLDSASANGAYAAPELRAVIQSLIPLTSRVERHFADPAAPF